MSGPLVSREEVQPPALPPELIELIASFLFRAEYTDDGDVTRLLDWYYTCEADFVKTAVVLSLLSLPTGDIPKDKTPYLRWITPFVKHRTNWRRNQWGARPIRPLPLRINDAVRLDAARPRPGGSEASPKIEEVGSEVEEQRFRIDIARELELYYQSERNWRVDDKSSSKKILDKATGNIKTAWEKFLDGNRDKKIIVAVDLGYPQPPEIAADLCKEIASVLSDVDLSHAPVYELHTRNCVVFGKTLFFGTIYVHTPGHIVIDTNDELTALIVSNLTQGVSVVNHNYTAKFESVVVGKNVTFIENRKSGSIISPRRVLFEKSDEPITLSEKVFSGYHLEAFESDRVVRWDNPKWRAFANCENIKTLRVRVESDLPEKTVFYSALERVEIAGLSLVSNELFPNRLGSESNLASIRFPDAVTIEVGAFGNKTKLRDVSMDSVVTIGGSAFSGCTLLVHVSIPNVETIGMSAFSRCTSLRRLDIPKVVTIGENAFGGCKSLKSLHAPRVKTIGDFAFTECESLKSLYLPEVETIGKNAFEKCEGLQVHLPRGFVGEISPATRAVSGTTAAHVVLKAFAGKHGGKPAGKKKGAVFKGINFPINIGNGELYEDILKRWGDFGNYPNVKVVVDFPAHAFGVEKDLVTLERLKNDLPAKRYELALRDCTIAGNAYFFGNMKFVRGSRITINNPGCDLHASVTGTPKIDVIVFNEQTFVPFKSTTVENSVNEMLKCSFLSAEKVTFLHGDTPIHLGEHAFAHSSAARVIAHRQVTCAKGALFTDCVNLRTASFDDIDNPSFKNCPRLEEVNLGGIEAISDSIFLMCPKLASVSCGQARSVQEEVFMGAVNLANVNLPSVTRVGSNAFDGCTALTRIALPSAQRIENFAFSGCTALRHVTIPATCRVDPHAFSLLSEPPEIERVL